MHRRSLRTQRFTFGALDAPVAVSMRFARCFTVVILLAAQRIAHAQTESVSVESALAERARAAPVVDAEQPPDARCANRDGRHPGTCRRSRRVRFRPQRGWLDNPTPPTAGTLNPYVQMSLDASLGGLFYLLTAVPIATGCSQHRCSSESSWLYLPVVGPIVYAEIAPEMRTLFGPILRLLYVADALLQAAGPVAALIEGLAWRRHYTSARSDPRVVRWAIAPSAPGTDVGATIVVTSP